MTLLPGVFRHREYTLLWLGQLVSNLGDTFQTLALAWLVKEQSGSSLLVGTVLAAYLLPLVLLGPVAGALVDQFDKRRLMMAADLLRMVLVGLLAVFYGLNLVHVWVIILLASLMGAAAALFEPARQGSLTFLVGEAELAQANSFAMVTRQGSQLVGPVAAGLVIARWGAGLAFWANAASFAVSALFLSLMRFRSTVRRAQRSLQGIREDMKAGLRTIAHHPLLHLILPVGVVVNFLLGPVPALLPVYTDHLTRLGAMALGYLQTASAAGMLVGSLLVGVTAGRWPKGRVAISGLIGAGLGITALGLVNSLPLAELALGIFGASMVLVNIPLVTVIQRETPVDHQGRVFSVFMSTTTAAQPLAMAVGGWLGDVVGIHPVYIGLGILFTLLSLGIAATPPLRNVQ